MANRYDNLRIPVAANLRVPGSTPYYGANGIQDYVDGFTHEGEFVLVAEDGANDLKNYPVKCVNGHIWVNNHAHVLQSKSEIADNKFLAYSISHAGIEALLVGGGRAKLNAEAMMGIDLIMPSLPEQVAVGHYLTQLDDLITLHQRNVYLLILVCFDKAIVWEQRKLGDVVGVYDGVHQTPHYTDSGIMFLSVENIATLTSQKYISEEAFARDYKVYPQKGDVLMTRIGDVGTTNVVETAEKLAFYVSLALLKPTGIDSYFLCNAIQSPRFQKGLKDRTLVTAIPQKINKDEIGKVDILMPDSQAEQAQVGAYFRQLDNLITLHQRE